MAKSSGPSDASIAIAMLIFGVVGGLIGFGTNGTLQGACLGAGIGALAALILIAFGS
jgi:hypothetical protein